MILTMRFVNPWPVRWRRLKVGYVCLNLSLWNSVQNKPPAAAEIM